MSARTTAAGGTIVDGRTLCAVIGCRRSSKGQWNWWICADHWRQVPMWAKRRQTALKRALRRRGELESNKRSWWATSHRAGRLIDRLGRFLIRVANARAAGL
jgi:hypothetical protein